MRDFAELARETQPQFPVQGELWTCYHLKMHPYPRCASDWGMCLVYHFDRGVSIVSWLRMVANVRQWVESQAELQQSIEFVPFYEVGADFFAQCKPPYDGGYPTTRYEEFLYHGDCEPAPWFYHQLADLHCRVADGLHPLLSDTRTELLRKVIHATFIKPYGHTFWCNEKGWAVYQPNISTDDVRKWEMLPET